MEGNKEEAIRCLSIASRHRSNSNLSSALKFAKKSVALYTTPEGEALITIIEREIETGGTANAGTSGSANASGSPSPSPAPSQSSAPTPNGTGPTTNSKATKATGVEEHVTSAHSRPGHGSSEKKAEPSSSTSTAKKREFTPKQLEVVKRVKACKHHEYYEILAVEKKCSENDVKRAYKKLALLLHPDKNGAPGADEAFKMVSKAFQVLSDDNLRSAYDSNPTYDPTQRNPGPSSFGRGGGGGMSGFGGGGPGMYQSEINPEDLFNMFFGGGGGGFGGNSPFGGANVFTFGGPGGFQAHYGGRPRRPAPRQAAGDAQASPLTALLPIIILFAFAMISIIPSLFAATRAPDPTYTFEPSRFKDKDLRRETSNWHVPYHVNRDEWEKSEIWTSVPEGRRGKGKEGLYSTKLRTFERGVENNYARRLQNDCQYFLDLKQQRINENSGFFGIGADHDKLKEIRASTSPACDQLRKWGIGTAAGW
ncbi:endoplasmic reticulum protein [Kwoniella heveanensis CBS 569]|nr:endoplasmic reticulum protein [Kwoniella heveanensis CBS 569]